MCISNDDCTSLHCDGNICRKHSILYNGLICNCLFLVAPTCDDEIQNQDEVDVDCGGPNCGGCEPEQNCVINEGCTSLNCFENICRKLISNILTNVIFQTNLVIFRISDVRRRNY